MEFDGEDDWVDTGSTLIEGEAEATLSAWAKPDAISNPRNIIADWSPTIVAGIYYNNGNLLGEVDTDTGSTSLTYANPDLDIWQYVALVYDGSNLLLYYNGEEVASGSLSGTIKSPDQKFGIGALNDGSNVFDGTIAIVRTYKVAKSSSWISRRFGRTRGIFGV